MYIKATKNNVFFRKKTKQILKFDFNHQFSSQDSNFINL